jgi:phenylalanyl-tRNA synthetase alpha chain
MSEHNHDPKHMTPGHTHPLSKAIEDISDIFADMGFDIADGPIIESEWYNFDALNVPKDHPARDMQDTFFIQGKEGMVLRTHTSPVQIRYMESHEPPLRVIAPGRVYRNEATDSSHEAQFFQLECLVVDKDITLAHLKGTLETFFSQFFGEEKEVRFRPGYFPFVEPGVEVDMRHISSKGERWLELMGAGMVHPHVLGAAGVDPKKWRGFAFGVGIERLVAVRSEIEDVRLFHTGDLRFVHQF